MVTPTGALGPVNLVPTRKMGKKEAESSLKPKREGGETAAIQFHFTEEGGKKGSGSSQAGEEEPGRRVAEMRSTRSVKGRIPDLS